MINIAVKWIYESWENPKFQTIMSLGTTGCSEHRILTSCTSMWSGNQDACTRILFKLGYRCWPVLQAKGLAMFAMINGGNACHEIARRRKEFLALQSASLGGWGRGNFAALETKRCSDWNLVHNNVQLRCKMSHERHDWRLIQATPLSQPAEAHTLLPSSHNSQSCYDRLIIYVSWNHRLQWTQDTDKLHINVKWKSKMHTHASLSGWDIDAGLFSPLIGKGPPKTLNPKP